MSTPQGDSGGAFLRVTDDLSAIAVGGRKRVYGE